MKYANIGWQETVRGSKAAINLGDNLQFLAIDFIYNKMGIEDVHYLDMSEVASYKGEKLVLPLNWCLFDNNYMRGDYLDISDNIEPVFLGMTVCSRDEERFFNRENINYLNQHGPIGCRDEYTYQKLSQHGIHAYLNGCVTITLPKRNKLGKKLFLVDAPVELRTAIENKMGMEYECMTQQCYLEIDEAHRSLRQMAINHYRYILENAAVVVTSRLHVASPCVALGIPVIFARREVDIRFGWIDKLLRLYDQDEFSEINWKPKEIVFENIKQVIVENNIRRIRGENIDEENEKISHFFRERAYREYCSFSNSLADVNRLKNYINREWDKKRSIKYVLWGVNHIAEEIYHYIVKTFPFAKMVGVIDDYKDVEFAGKRSVAHNQIELDEEYYVLVVAVAASNAAYNFMGQRERLFLLGDVFIQ